MVLRALILLVLLSLCACAPMTVAPTQSQTIKRVAVMSAIGDKFTVKKVGLTVFGNDQKDFPIESWGIDDFVVGKLRGLLSARFDVRPVTYQKSAFNTTGNNFKNVAEAVKAQATSADIDAYVVVTKGFSQYGGSNQTLQGLGIVNGAAAALTSETVHLYALYWMTVVDGHQFTVIANAPAVPLGETMFSFKAVRGPVRELDPSWMPASLDAGQNARLKGAVMELLGQNLPSTLQGLKIME
jgi:hypothetical protein